MTRFGSTPVDAADLVDATGDVVGVRIVHPDGEPCWGVPFGEQCRCGLINTDPAAPPVIVPVAELDERALVCAAARRLTVTVLDSGQTRLATLIRWGGQRRGRWQHSVRVQWGNGHRVSLPARAVTAVHYPPGPDYAAPTIRH